MPIQYATDWFSYCVEQSSTELVESLTPPARKLFCTYLFAVKIGPAITNRSPILIVVPPTFDPRELLFHQIAWMSPNLHEVVYGALPCG